MTTVKSIKTALSGIADSVGRNKAGNFVVRRGYFYRNGMDSDKFADRVVQTLAAANITVRVVESRDNWRPFKGGGTVAQNSHWFVEFGV